MLRHIRSCPVPLASFDNAKSKSIAEHQVQKDFFDSDQVRRYRLGRSLDIAKLSKWAKSESALASELLISEVRYLQETGTPSHDYIVVKLVHANRTISDTFLRMERDSTTWLSVWGSDVASEPKDSITISTKKPTDDFLASFTLLNSRVDLHVLVHLLQQIATKSASYNVYTFNCWWFARRVWTNLAVLTKHNAMNFRLGERVHEKSELLEIVNAANAVDFGRRLELLLIGLVRYARNTKEDVEAFKKLRECTAAIDTAFQGSLVRKGCRDANLWRKWRSSRDRDKDRHGFGLVSRRMRPIHSGAFGKFLETYILQTIFRMHGKKGP